MNTIIPSPSLSRNVTEKQAVATFSVPETDITMAKLILSPGWHWKKDVGHLTGQDHCMLTHDGYCISGSLIVKDADGNRTTISAGDFFHIPPKHDGWVNGIDDFVSIEVRKAGNGTR